MVSLKIAVALSQAFFKAKREIEMQYKDNVVGTGIKRCHENKNKLYKKYLNIPSAFNAVNYKLYRNLF